jgi:two-component system sensor histidine kinase SenX3
VAPLGSRLVLALVEDRTRERRVEAVRRDFVANVSHELKTPVGAIRLLAEAVTDASDDPEAVQRFAGRMLTESDRLSKLVQQIIELSRLQGDDPLETPARVCLDDVVAAAVDTSIIDAGAKGITLVTTGDRELEVFGSLDQISSAVTNLVSNAVTYSEAGSRVLVSTKSLDDTAQISVVDQGIGIPAREIDRIFERFYRVDPARHRSTGGTGLGLSIVKHVAATHGGDVSVWSVEGQGSTFTLTLPLSPESGTGPMEPVAMVAPVRRTPKATDAPRRLAARVSQAPRAADQPDVEDGVDHTKQQEVRR